MFHRLKIVLSWIFSFRRKDSLLPAKVLLGAAVLLGLTVVWTFGKAHGSNSLSAAHFELKDGTTLIPESERPLDVCVIGVEASRSPFYFLPDIKPTSVLPKGRVKDVHRQLYWLNFEISHGRILNALPHDTQVYVALPDPKSVKEADGTEEALFRGYLKARCGWTDQDIQTRIHFFKTPVPIVWAQDIGKILGRDAQGRWIICRGFNDQNGYGESIAALCNTYPDLFACRNLPQGVSAEGGDEDLVRSPEGHLVFLVGRHRARHYLEWAEGHSLGNQVLSQEEVSQVRDLFSSAFYDIPAVFMPTRALENPALGNNELFHLDMSVAVISSGGKTQAFVPSYSDHPMDRMSSQPLDATFVKSLQAEYDLMASELSALGYPVARLTITDHPVRSPANLVRYTDPATGQCTVLLAKYPNHLPGGVGPTPQQKLLDSLQDLRERGSAWEKSPVEQNFHLLRESIDGVWKTMDWAASQPNPYFEKNRELFQKAGIQVVAVPDFAWGAGGLHCQLLH